MYKERSLNPCFYVLQGCLYTFQLVPIRMQFVDDLLQFVHHHPLHPLNVLQLSPRQVLTLTHWHWATLDTWHVMTHCHLRDLLLSEAVILVLGRADFNNAVVILSRVILK